jgi:hypothetical protein
MKLHDRISNIFEAKLDATLQAMCDPNGYNNVVIINSLQNMINVVTSESGNQIPKADAEVMIAAAQELVRPLRRPVAEQASQFLNSKLKEKHHQSSAEAILWR